jgi:uncharacterized damage-inducible protein DinB
MKDTTFGKEYCAELEAEGASSRKCIERILPSLFKWKPHERSMEMGALAILVAEIPRWIYHMIELGDIDFATFHPSQAKTPQELVKLFDENMANAKEALQKVSDEALEETFSLKRQGEVLFSSPKKINVMQSINHLVHHRGQLTIYLRLNNIPVPSIYGPSADDKTF